MARHPYLLKQVDHSQNPLRHHVHPHRIPSEAVEPEVNVTASHGGHQPLQLSCRDTAIMGATCGDRARS